MPKPFIPLSPIPSPILILILILPLSTPKEYPPQIITPITFPNLTTHTPPSSYPPSHDLLFITTRDGTFHSVTPTPPYTLQWSLPIGTDLISSHIANTKITEDNDFILLPLDDKLFLYKNNTFTPLDAYIKDLVEKAPQSFGEYLLLGNKHSTVFKINIDSGEIVQHSDKEHNLVAFGSDVHSYEDNNIITIIRIDYVLSCFGKEDKFWDANYGEVIIQRSKYYKQYAKQVHVYERMLNALFDNVFDEKEVLSVYGYDRQTKTAIRMYYHNQKENESNNSNNGVSNSNTNVNWNGKRNTLNEKANADDERMLKWQRRNRNPFEGIDTCYEDDMFSSVGKYEFMRWKGEKHSITISEILYTFVIGFKLWLGQNASGVVIVNVVIIIIGVILLLIRNVYNTLHNKYVNINDNASKDNNDECISKEQYIVVKRNYVEELFMKYIEEKNKQQQESSSINNDHSVNDKEDIKQEDIGNTSLMVYSPVKHANSNNNININEDSKNELCVLKGNNSNTTNNNNKIQQTLTMMQHNLIPYQTNRVDIVDIDSRENEHNSITIKIQNTSYVTYEKNETTIKIHQLIKEGNKSTQSSSPEEKRNSSQSYDSNYNIQYSQSEHSNSQNQSQSKNTMNININGEQEQSSIVFANNSQSNNCIIFTNTLSNNQHDHQHVNTSSQLSQSSITTPKQNIQHQHHQAHLPPCRLDKDFTDLVKLGEGGFGIVLKAKHKIDLNIYAIKIIAINNLNVQSVSAEVRTMLKIRSKHIVEYKTCWTDTSLGSASAFFSQSEQSSLLTSTFKKSTPNQSNINNDSTCNKNPKNKVYYNEVLSDEIQQSKHLQSKHSKPITDFIDDSNYQLNAQKSKMSRNTFLTQDYIDNLYFFIQMEYCNGLPLDKYIKSHSSIPHKTIFTFTQQILKSLNKIHSSGIIHRDIKPANIFVNNGCDIKIGDFGLATNIHSSINKEELVGTFLYLSPEQLSHKHYDERVDIFASGLVLYEMCACFETLMERRESIIALKNGKGVVQKVKESYPYETELILLMTKGDYKERPSASEIMNSKEFQMWKVEIERSNN